MAYIRLTFSHRQIIEKLLGKGVTVSDISEKIGISKTTVYDELANNLSPEDYKARKYGNYSAKDAQERAENNAIAILRK